MIFPTLLFTFVGPDSALYVTTDQGPSSLSLAAVSTLSWDAGRLVSYGQSTEKFNLACIFSLMNGEDI